MAQTSTMHLFDISLSDVDRGHYETLSLKVAQHPSESAEYMMTRVLAYALEHQEGIAFSQGLAFADEPAVWVRDLTGVLRAWIEIGTPDAARLHRASKATERVVVYCHKDVEPYFKRLRGERVYNHERLELVEVDRRFIAALAGRVERRNTLGITVTDGEVYVDLGGEPLHTVLVRHGFPT
jgi:uncharacterized protein YaeQ